MYACMYVCIHIYIYTHIVIYIYIYIYIYMGCPSMDPPFLASGIDNSVSLFVFQGRGLGFRGSRVRVWGLGKLC